MGQYCWMCGRVRANEAFSGKNHGRHLCRECARVPPEVRESTRRVDALWSMLFRQRVISAENIRMATEWAADRDSEVVALAQIVAEIGRVCPGRKRRMQKIRDRHPDLWARMTVAGVIDYDQLESSRPDYDDARWLADPADVADPGAPLAPDPLARGDDGGERARGETPC